MAAVPAPVDPADYPALSGVFTPIGEERDATDLVVKGELPADLRGAYFRNGPNPMFPPLGSYTFPLEGDPMLHGLWLEDGTVRYRNRYVWNPQLRLEQQAGHALWAGIMTPYLPGPDVVPEQYANGFKPAPFIHIVNHGGRWLAMSEIDPPWEVTADLEVVGTEPFTWGGAMPGVSPHTRIDPATGDMYVLRYDLAEPYLAWGCIAADGTVAKPLDPIEIGGSYMIHDFVITEHHVVVFVMPTQFDLNALMTGSGDPLVWDGTKPVRIAVIPKTGTSADARWFETDAFWVYHFANAFESGDEIVVDLCRFKRFALGPVPDQTGGLTRVRIDTRTGAVSLTELDDRISEFPRIDDRVTGLAHRYLSASTKAGPAHHVGEFNVLVRADTHTGGLAEWDSGSKVFGEVAFAQAEGRPAEEGYYVTFRTDLDTLQSDWVVLDAGDIAAGPVATVELPFRVPAGLHGSWFPTAALG